MSLYFDRQKFENSRCLTAKYAKKEKKGDGTLDTPTAETLSLPQPQTPVPTQALAQSQVFTQSQAAIQSQALAQSQALTQSQAPSTQAGTN